MYVAVVAAGFAAGFINTLAGSGSLITLPLLIFLGLPAPVANATMCEEIRLSSMSITRMTDARSGTCSEIPSSFSTPRQKATSLKNGDR